MPEPRVLILRAPGTNCDEETAAAWTRAGARVETWHVNRLLAAPDRLDHFEILTIPGGFSHGDDLGAGRILAVRLARLGAALERFRDRGGLILGICNGFQVLVRAGLLPGAGITASLTFNDSGHFEARWVRLRARRGPCAFLDDDGFLELPVAHGEGKFLTAHPDDPARLQVQGQVVLQYVGTNDQPTLEYPANPNGSAAGIAGVCDPTGRILGLMPHPERFVDGHHHPRWTRQGAPAEGDGLRIFRAAVRSLA